MCGSVWLVGGGLRLLLLIFVLFFVLLLVVLLLLSLVWLSVCVVASGFGGLLGLFWICLLFSLSDGARQT